MLPGLRARPLKKADISLYPSTAPDEGNLVVNGDGATNQRVYASGTPTTVANQVTLDRWRVVVSGQSLVFTAAAPGRVMTAPAGGVEQIIEAGWVRGGLYTFSWEGSASGKVNGVSVVNGGSALVLANTAVTLQLAGGTFGEVRFRRADIAAAPPRRLPPTELLLCQRDFAKSYALATVAGSVASVGRYFVFGNLAASINFTISLPVQMRTAPTVTLYDPNGNVNSLISISSGGGVTTRAASVSNQSERSFEIAAAISTDVAVIGHWLAATGF